MRLQKRRSRLRLTWIIKEPKKYFLLIFMHDKKKKLPNNPLQFWYNHNIYLLIKTMYLQVLLFFLKKKSRILHEDFVSFHTIIDLQRKLVLAREFPNLNSIVVPKVQRHLCIFFSILFVYFETKFLSVKRIEIIHLLKFVHKKLVKIWGKNILCFFF